MQGADDGCDRGIPWLLGFEHGGSDLVARRKLGAEGGVRRFLREAHTLKYTEVS